VIFERNVRKAATNFDVLQRAGSENSMKKGSASKASEPRAEYDLSQLAGGVLADAVGAVKVSRRRRA